MYTRSFGEPNAVKPDDPFGPTVRSEGQLYNMRQPEPPPPPPPPREERAPAPPGAGMLGPLRSALGKLQTDDLILMAIGLLILLDGSEGNDVIAVFILALLFL